MTKVMLAVETDSQCLSVVRNLSSDYSLDLLEADDLRSVTELVALRTPDIALIAVDTLGAECADVFAELESSCPDLQIVLVGNGDWRVMAGVRALARRYGLRVVSTLGRPVELRAFDQVLATLFPRESAIESEEIEGAIREGQFVLHYQVKAFGHGDGYVVRGVEALVRWNHPRLGLLYPSSFLSMVVDAGQMAQLTDYIIADAVRQVGIWRQHALHLQLGLNISSDLVTDIDFPRRLRLLLDEHGVSPADLVIDVADIKEDDRSDMVRDVFTHLRLMGVGLCLDHFGTGGASLSVLLNMPFTEVKLDGALIRRVLYEAGTEKVLACMVDLMHAMGLVVCAAGVESEAALACLHAAGFDAVQGNAVGAVLPPAELLKTLRTDGPKRHVG